MSKNENVDLEVNNDHSTESVGLFTQEQVEGIVKKRLRSEKERYNRTLENEVNKVVSERLADLEGREKDVTTLSVRLKCKEYLLDNNMDSDLLDVIDTSDFDGFVERAEKLKSIRSKNTMPLPRRDPRINDTQEDPFTSLQHSKHKPKVNYN